MMKESVAVASVAALGMAAYALIQRRENRDERDEPQPEPEPISAEEAQRRQQAMSPDWVLLKPFLAAKTRELKPRPKICDTALDAIGNTPLIRLQKVPGDNGVACEMLAKCEFFNAGGSVKDRIGKRMVLDALESKRIKIGDKLIEPTSGNTGIGIALAGAVLGFEVIITLPEKMSDEKVNVLKALGATIHRTPTEAASSSPESHISLAKRLCDKYNAEVPGSAHILDQYANVSNPLAHYDGTAEELIQQCDGKIDMVVLGAGTGGTITGIARKLKAAIPGVVIVGVDPDGSLLAKGEDGGEPIKGYAVEGIGYDFVPDVCDRGIVDDWVKSFDQESFDMARALIRKEGLLCGGSCGTAVAAAMKAVKGQTLLKKVKPLRPDQRCVVLLPDSTRNYMTKFLTDKWMQRNKFMSMPETDAPRNTVGSLIETLQLRAPMTCKMNDPIEKALKTMMEKDFTQLPVLNEHKAVVGLITVDQIHGKLGKPTVAGGTVMKTDAVDSICVHFKNAKKDDPFVDITKETNLGALDDFFNHNYCAFVTSGSATGKGASSKKVEAVITKLDLLQYQFRV